MLGDGILAAGGETFGMQAASMIGTEMLNVPIQASMSEYFDQSSFQW